MNTGTFYGAKSTPFRAVTLQETTNFVESCSNAASATVTILPPECGDQDIPTDEEDFEYGQEDQVFEPAGEMEVAAVSISEDDEEEFHQKYILINFLVVQNC